MRSQWRCFLSFFSSTFLLSWQPPEFICHALFAPHTHTQRCERVCVCVYNLRFSLFSHSSLRFEIQAVSHKLHLLGTFHFPLSSIRFLLPHFPWATQTFAYFGAPSRVSIRCWLIIAAASASMLRHSIRHSLRQSGSLAVCQCASPALWQCVSWSEMRPQRRQPLAGRGRTRLCQ